MQSLIVFSHLRWDSVRRRPHHLMSRLGRRWQVVYVEEPMPNAARDELEVFEPAPGVEVWRPHVTGTAKGFHDDHAAALRQLVADEVRERGIAGYWLWFYTPMALPVAAGLKPRGIVYDCMDELSHFEGTATQLVQRENALFKTADLVFAAGPSIYNAKRSRHPDVHCFPDSVNAAHFQRRTGEPALHREIPHPRLGFCGAIDARINLGLVEAIAKARPEWNIVMVGATEGIAPAMLPRQDNIHWAGLQSHDDVPAFIQGWDVCLMPFALNEATRSISPAQTLEYMACGRPIVSTSIRDVVETYGHSVRIADTPQGFVTDIEMLLARTREERDAHAREMAAIVAQTSWDTTAAAMAELVAQADELVPLPTLRKDPAVPARMASRGEAGVHQSAAAAG